MHGSPNQSARRDFKWGGGVPGVNVVSVVSDGGTGAFWTFDTDIASAADAGFDNLAIDGQPAGHLIAQTSARVVHVGYS